MKNMVYQHETQAFAHRLRSAMRQAGFKTSATVLANEFNLRYWGNGITTHAARNWLIGSSLSKQDKLRVLSEWLRVNPKDLLFGLSETHKANESNQSLAKLNMIDAHMMHLFLNLNKDYQRMIREIVSALDAIENQYNPIKTTDCVSMA
ncbi:MAG: hypothetical protein EXR35_09085 [Limnohabitans sp.]|nr:hypothetical protein [Limnohabitans sp.]